MTDAPLFLAFDTSGPHCSVAVGQGESVIASAHVDMKRGQAEHLMPLIEESLEQAGATLQQLAVIGVGIGPGNFTGIRISVAAARGLAFALGVPAVSLSNFELMRMGAKADTASAELVVLNGPRQQAYAQMFRNGRPDGPPLIIDPDAPPLLPGTDTLVVMGQSAAVFADALGGRANPSEMDDLPGRMIGLTHQKWMEGPDPGARPAPLYVRAADAAPSRDTAPKILS